jgi:O-acetyl-ADP-ribose deacetylase (regulator of RNase III)
MPDPTEIDVWQGEIAQLEVDAIIIAASESLFMTGPVSRAVRLRAGEEVERAAVDQGPIEAGTAVATPGGALAAPFVIHVVAVGHDLRPDRERLLRAVNAACDIAGQLGLRRVAMAPLGTERGVFGAEESAAALAEVLSARAAAARWVPTSMVVAVSSPAEASAFTSALEPIRPTAR